MIRVTWVTRLTWVIRVTRVLGDWGDLGDRVIPYSLCSFKIETVLRVGVDEGSGEDLMVRMII